MFTRVCSVYYRPNSSRRGTTVTAPSGLRSRVCGQSLRPSLTPQPPLDSYNLSSLTLTPGDPTPYVCMYVSTEHTHMWNVRGYVLSEGGVIVEREEL